MNNSLIYVILIFIIMFVIILLFYTKSKLQINEHFYNILNDMTNRKATQYKNMCLYNNIIDKNCALNYTYQYFNNSYCSDGEYSKRFYSSKKNNSIDQIVKDTQNSNVIAIYIGDPPGTPENVWQVSYVINPDVVTRMYERYGTMTPYNPFSRHVFINIANANTSNVLQTKAGLLYI